MAFGAGVLVSALAFDLVLEAEDLSRGPRPGGRRHPRRRRRVLRRRRPDRPDGRRGPQVVRRRAGRRGRDWPSCSAPCSTASRSRWSSGLGLLEGDGVSVAFVAAVFLSNLPEGLAATSGLLTSGWSRARIVGPVGRGDRRVRPRRTGRLRPVRRCVAGRGGLRPGLRRRRHPLHARRHDDARGLRARGQGGRALHRPRLRPGLRPPRQRGRRRPRRHRVGSRILAGCRGAAARSRRRRAPPGSTRRGSASPRTASRGRGPPAAGSGRTGGARAGRRPTGTAGPPPAARRSAYSERTRKEVAPSSVRPRRRSTTTASWASVGVGKAGREGPRPA